MPRERNMSGVPASPRQRVPPASSFSSEEARSRLRRRRKEILAESAEALLAGKDPDREVMPDLFSALADEKIVDGTLGYIVTEMEEGMKLGFMEGFDRAMIQRCLTLDFGQAVCGTVAVTRQPMHIGDIQGSLDPMTELVRSAGINAYACEPLIVGGRLLGTMSFASRSRRAFDVEDLMFFRAVAKQLAIARDRALRARESEPVHA
jgi:GAF domain-containing protein